MLILGITGSIATGKSTVSTFLQSICLWPLIDTDLVAKETIMIGTSTYKKVVDTFGKDIIMEDGSIDREALGRYIFSNKNGRKTLNKIIHPEVLKRTIHEIIKAWIRGEDVIIVDVPLLFESGFDYFCGKIICVACQENTQIERLRTRNGYAEEDSMKRIESQMPLCDKIELADIVIWNDGNKKELEEKIKGLIKNIKPSRARCLIERVIPVFAIISIIYIIIKRWLRKKKIK
ncbi:dephospho-CoA kinase [Pneumocystis carinii B80]|uniref:Dephospho-CoA kinase n=1 Tax=Pneumocystis carinii (strain B80) TaxID=1408658 RepID=A0A0W4ZBQ7_PNEC8|nr:dephospho-CoA kinase [Pneumocystis carinii B80]KTW25799.1 dephospho-CoA kinase [Pneumocystis carinii B80]